MQVFTDNTEFADIRVIQRQFESNSHMQRLIKCGLLGIEYDDELDVDDYDSWTHGHNSFHGYPANDRRLSGKHMTSSSSGYRPPLHYFTSLRVSPSSSPEKVQAKESDTERKARLLQEAKKSKEKAEKKRLKKQKQKQRKQMEKEKQNPIKNKEGKDGAEQPKAEESKPVGDQKDNVASGNLGAAAKDTDSDSDSSEQESGDEDDDTRNDSSDSEYLDMASTFVSKAALIAKRKLEQKPKAEQKERRKTPDKGQRKSVQDQTSENQEVAKEAQKDSVAPGNPAIEDNVKISTDLAILGNKFASAGDYNMAVKYFTDAIKYNPTEFKLFGNRSFCFEKLQEYEKALADAELSLGICPGWVKGLFRKGRALAGLKRYEEAAQAFRGVLKLDSSYAEAAQELMRVQIIQLMEYGFTREQSSNALIIHGTVNKALEVLSKLNYQPGAVVNGILPAAQVANVTGVSPILSANTSPALTGPLQSHNAHSNPLPSRPVGPVLNIPNIQSPSKPIHNQFMKNKADYQPPPDLFPVWVGNLFYPVTDATITNLFSKAGAVYSVKVLQYKRCAFVNFTKQEHCDEAIRRFHGYVLNGTTIAVRYPDRIPPGMGISKSALKADDLQDENLSRQHVDGRNATGSRKPFRPFKPVPDTRGNH